MFRRARIVLLTVLVAVVVSGTAAGSLPSGRAAVPLPAPATPGAAPGSTGPLTPPGAPVTPDPLAPATPAPASSASSAAAATPALPGPAADPTSWGERQLVAENDAVDRLVARQELRVDTAAQAHEDMLIDLARLRTRMADVRARHDRLRQEAVERAVALYINPRDDLVEHLLDSADVTEGARRRAFVAALQASSHTVGDQLRRTERDLRELEALSETSEAQAGEAQLHLAAQTADLAPLQERKVRLSSALRQRIEALTAEADGHEAGEAAILRVIAEEAAPAPPPGTPPAPVAQVVWPADGEITSEFGLRWGVLHRGIDIAGPEGTTVVASRAGRVIEAGWTSGYGLTVIVDHGDGSTSLYAHLSAIDVGEGDQLAAGGSLGAMGSTGNSTGPHLHFETRIDGEAQDPRGHLP